MTNDLYLTVKAIHVIAVISWMAGLLYLPRLFVYHAGVPTGSETGETFKIMERRLVNAIMTPAAIATWIMGLILATSGGLFQEGWFQVKFVLILMMTGVHFYLMRLQAAFAQDKNRHTPRFYRILNEVPTLLMIAIVVLVVTKPF